MAAQAAATDTKRNHVVIFPFFSKGHTIPLLHFSAALTRHGSRVTLLTTSANSTFIHQYLDLPHPNIDVRTLPFPRHSSVPPGCESTDTLPPASAVFKAFVHATRLLDRPFHDALQSLRDKGDLPLAVVSDMFLWWTRPICGEFGVPWLLFNGAGVFSNVVTTALMIHQPHRAAASPTTEDSSGEVEFEVPGIPNSERLVPGITNSESLLRLKLSDFPSIVRSQESEPFGDCVEEMARELVYSWGILINSFAAMESEYVGSLESYHGNIRGWLVGPLSLYNPRPQLSARDYADDLCLRWLDGKPARSVLYVSFGTQAEMSDEQLDEIAHGLDESGHNFLWVVRSPTWVPPEGILERLRKDQRNRGMLHRAWAPQREVLSHPATGGFLSHCGWNSVLEAISAGVPILALPLSFDQPLNAKFVVDVARVGLRMPAGNPREVVRRTAVCDGVRELMSGEKGRKATERAANLRNEATAAVGQDGSSSSSLEQLLEDLRAARSNLDGSCPSIT